MNFTRVYWSKKYLKQSNSYKLYTLLLIIWLPVIIGSCKKADDFYLEGNAPEQPFGLFTDTLDISLQTDAYRPQTHSLENDLLGTYADPVFGRSTAGVYSQLSLSQFNPSFTGSSRIDSFVLYIKLNKNIFNGNLADAQTLKIYRLNTAPQATTPYFADTTFELGMQVGSYNGHLNQKDSILRIKLDTAFARIFLNEPKNTFSANASFVNFLKGIAILPDSTGITKGNGAIVLTDLASTRSGMVLYYDTTRSFAMRFGTNPRVNAYSKNLSGTEAGKALSTPNHLLGKAYIQSVSGLRINATIPGMNEFADKGRILVHRADMIFPKVDSAADPLNNKYPEKILVSGRTKEGNNVPSDIYADWNNSDKQYRILITRYIQFLADNFNTNPEFTDYGFNLNVVPNAPVTPFRAVLYTGNKRPRSPKLIITYTKLAQ